MTIRHTLVPDQRRDRLIALARQCARETAVEAERCDETGAVNLELIEALRNGGYLAAPIPVIQGGGGHPLVDVVMAQAELAQGDPATALGVGMHLMVVGSEAWGQAWSQWRRRELFRLVTNGALLNVLATEPEAGAPQGRGRPATCLRADAAGGWRLYGAKTFSTLAPALTHAIVWVAFDDGSGDVGRVLVRMDDPAIAIEHTWDTLGMRATASHTVHFAGVPVRERDVIARQPFTVRAKRPAMSPWFALPVAAVYLGIARAARDEAVAFARERRPGGSGPPVATEPHVRHSIAQIELRLQRAETLLLSAAATAQQRQRTAPGLSPLEAAAKLEVTSSAIDIVDLAMRVVGGSALQRTARLERLCRDVRSGPVHPPTDAAAIEILAANALDRGPRAASTRG